MSPPLFLIPAPGGQEQSRVLGPELSSYQLDGLEPGTSYRLWLSVLGPSGEGPPIEVTAYTGEPRRPMLSRRALLPTDDPTHDFLHPMTLSDYSWSTPTNLTLG